MTYREIEGPIEGYKIFNEDMTCRDFQFKPGMNELGNDKPLDLCENGFHFCKYPSGVWSYYVAGRVFRVRAYGVLDTPQDPGADLKMCCRKIEILDEIFTGGDGNTGDGNTGDWNTGDWNTGNGNTGNGNTGNRNTGNWNAGDQHSGHFGIGDAPVLFFGKSVKDVRRIDWDLAERLGRALAGDVPFDVTPFLALPNATKTYIKRLHKAHVEGRKRLGVE